MSRILWMLTASAALCAAATLDAGAAPIPGIAQAPGQKTPTNAAPILFSVLFTESVLGFTSEDVVPSHSAGILVREVSPYDGTTYEITLSSVEEDGTVCVSIPAGAAMGLDGTPSGASTGADACVVLDRLAPPPPPLLEPADQAATSDMSPRFAWTVPDDLSGIAKYEVEIRGPDVRDYTTTRTSYAPTLKFEGAHTWRVNCRDGAGNIGAWTPWRTLTLDVVAPTPPALEWSSVAETTWGRADSLELAFAAADDAGSGVDGYAVAWGRTASSPVTGPVNRSGTWAVEDFSPPEDGEWWCHAVAVDRAGNRSVTVEAGPFCIDRSPPTLAGIGDTIRLPNDPGRLSATADWSLVTATDALDPAPSIRFSVPTGSLLPLGESSLFVTLEDRAGNLVVRPVSVVVYNTEPPCVRIVWPADRERLRLGDVLAPWWDIDSLAPIASVRTKGAIGGCLDTRAPGRHEFSVAVTDTTGLEASASVEYVVTYSVRHVELARVRPDASEELLWAIGSSGDAKVSEPTCRSSEWLRVRCRVDSTPADVARPPITLSLVRTVSPPAAPIVEATRLLADNGETYTADVPLALFHPGRYTLWIGFIDGANESFSFQLVR